MKRLKNETLVTELNSLNSFASPTANNVSISEHSLGRAFCAVRSQTNWRAICIARSVHP